MLNHIKTLITFPYKLSFYYILKMFGKDHFLINPTVGHYIIATISASIQIGLTIIIF